VREKSNEQAVRDWNLEYGIKMAAAPLAQHILRKLKTSRGSVREKSNEQAVELKRSNANLAAPVRSENRRTNAGDRDFSAQNGELDGKIQNGKIQSLAECLLPNGQKRWPKLNERDSAGTLCS
jgi:hypothetical protein